MHNSEETSRKDDPPSRHDRDNISFAAVDARSEEAIDAMTAYFDELAVRFPEGFDPGDTLVDDAASFDEPEGVFLIGRVSAGSGEGSGEGSSAEMVFGCGGVHRLDEGCAEIKRMWIHPEWRGRGLGRRLLQALEGHGTRLGYETIRLDTNSALTEAIQMYESSGYRTIPRYNDNPFAKHWFEKQLEPER